MTLIAGSGEPINSLVCVAITPPRYRASTLRM
jgi:hypothetical protein